MRIALNGRFLAAPVTGVQRFARQVGRRLRERDDVVWLLPADVEPPAGVDEARVVRGRLRGHAWEQTELPWRVRGAGCDVCLNLAGTLPAAGGPHVGVVHDVLPLTDPQWFAPAFAAWYRIAVGRNARRAARLVTVSRWSAARIAETLRLGPDRIDIAEQGIEPFDHAADPADVENIRARHALAEPYVLAVGRGDPRKNLPFIIEVMREWRRQDDAAPQLVVVGRASSRVHGEAAEDGSSEGVRMLGRVDDAELHALYTGALAFAFPSLAEGFGRPPLEAAACGTPAVVAPYGSALEVLGDGALVAPLQVPAWIAQLRRLRDDPAERADLVARGAAIARSRTWDAGVQTVLDACVRATQTPVPA